MGTGADIRNRKYGPGTQNNNNAAGTQYIVSGEEVHFVHNFNPAERNRKSLASHVQHNRLTVPRAAHKTLWDTVGGIGASHDAEQQYERGTCLKGTRERAIERVFKWILSPDGPPLLWLTGAAGVGKSAIAMTVAKLSEENGQLVTSFFFFRADPKRNNASALIPAIAYGLVKSMPLLRDPIEQRISRDPMILEACMEDQFRELVVNPLTQPPPLPSPKPSQPPLPLPNPPKLPSPDSPKLPFRQRLLKRIRKILGQRVPVDGAAQAKTPSLVIVGGPDESGDERTQDHDGTAETKVPYVVVIDGLDECGDENTQIRILSIIRSAFERSTSFPLRFLICSRPESWLRHAFNEKPLQTLHDCIVLDDSFEPDADIERYYQHHFQEIVSNPEYAEVVFPSPWPSERDLEILVEWTSGQFIYAATVIKFLKLKAEHPVIQLGMILERTRNHKPKSYPSPYQKLDALYDVILIANSKHEETILILAAIIVRKTPTPAVIELVLGLPQGQVALTLRGMHSVLNIPGRSKEILLFHNSFREYLLDLNRSGSFHIDETNQRHAIGLLWLQNLSTKKIQSYRYETNYPFAF